MKRFFSLFLIVPLLFWACQRVEAPYLTVSEDSIEVSSEGETITLSLKANNPWSVTASQWCTVSPSRGDGGEFDVEITVAENDTYAERSCTLTFKSGELVEQIEVTQLANKGVVLPQDKYKVSSGAQQLEVTVKANVPYKVEVNVDWIEQVGTKSLETTVFLFDIAENDTYDARQGIINIIDQESKETITVEVEQVQKDAIFVSPSEYNLTSEEHVLDLKVQTNVELEVVIPEAAKSWVSHVETKALEDKVVRLMVAANTTYEARACEILVKKKGENYSETVSISQEMNMGVVVEEKSYSVSPGAQALEVKLKTNAPLQYEVSDEAKDWISVVETKALEDKVLVLSISENKTFDVRTGKVLVRVERSNMADTLKITQAYRDTLYASQKMYELPKEGETITVKLNTTLEYEVELKDEWISEVQTKAISEKTHAFAVAANSEVQGRNGYIVFKSKTTEHKDTVVVSQAGSGGYIWYNGIVAATSVPGKGTENDPYIINTANDLQWLINQTIESTTEDIKTMGKYYKLTHDIEIDSDEGRGWTPIGMGTDDSIIYATPNVFSGYFDGGGHKITGKMVPGSQLSSEGNLYFGFFGFCKAWSDPNGDGIFDYIPTIKNLDMCATVTVPSISTEFENAYIGALVGYSYSSIELANCSNSGVVTGFDGSGESHDVYLAGLIGLSEYNVTITDCENTGEIKGGTLSGRWFKAWTAGVVAGATNTTAKNISNRGKVYGATAYHSMTGGVFGQTSVLLLEKVNNYAVVYGGNAESTAHTGGVAADVMYSYSGQSYIKDCHNSAEIFGGDAPLNIDFADYPYKYIGGLFGVATDITEINNCSNSGKVNAKVIHKHPTYGPGAEIGGLFGQNHSNVYDCSNSGDLYVERGGTIGGLAGMSQLGHKTFTRSVNTGNITLVDCCFSSEIGGISGATQSVQFSECVNKGALKVSESYTYENSGSISIGGIVGVNYGTWHDDTTHEMVPNILNCTNEGKVEVLTPVTNSVYCGGIAGHQGASNGYIKGCKNTATIISNNAKGSRAFTAGIIALTWLTYVDNCVNTGDVIGGVALTSSPYYVTTAVGGIVAFLTQGMVFNACENAGTVRYNDSSITTNLGSAVGYLEYDAENEYTSKLCPCTKDTSGQGLPMIGGGHTELMHFPKCDLQH